MKNWLLAALLLPALALVLPACRGLQTERPMTADEFAVRSTVENYVLAFYRAEPERLKAVLSPELHKLGFWRETPELPYGDALHMSYDQALALAEQWNKNGQEGDGLTYSIELFEVSDKTACAKVTAVWGQDYVLLAKEGDSWRIHHVLWQSASTANTNR